MLWCNTQVGGDLNVGDSIKKWGYLFKKSREHSSVVEQIFCRILR